MKSLIRILMLASACSVMAMPSAQAQGGVQGSTYTISYIETSPAGESDAAALLKDLAKASRASAGNLRFEVLQRRERSNHFAIVEAWRDKAAHDAHLAAEHTRNFRAKLAPLLISGYDERPHTGLATGPLSAGSSAASGAVFAVTHVDVIPPKKDETMVLLQQLAGPSRSESGNLRYEALQQNSRPNHFTLVEIWYDQNALEAHETAAHTKTFRDVLMPMSGSLFDQRLYRTLD
jgi:quinol monooxygenase YgiN